MPRTHKMYGAYQPQVCHRYVALPEGIAELQDAEVAGKWRRNEGQAADIMP
ncbi:MAG: hypothetical protein IJ196_08260 [Prevotella sp.]|nr:hypothetical protein [Prevotella sp.]